MHAQIGRRNPGARNAVAISLEMAFEHTPTKVGKNLKNGPQERVKVVITDSRNRGRGGCVRPRDGAIKLCGIHVDGLAWLNKTVFERPSSNCPGRDVEHLFQVRWAAQSQSLGEKHRINLYPGPTTGARGCRKDQVGSGGWI